MKPMLTPDDFKGRWTLTAPNGKEYRAQSPEACAKLARESDPALLLEARRGQRRGQCPECSALHSHELTCSRAGLSR
jgi:hypothetical protein